MSKRSRSPTVSRFILIVGIMLALALILGACAEEEPTEVTRIVEVPGDEVEVTRIVEVVSEVEVPGPEVEVTRVVEVMVEPEEPAMEIPEQATILTAWEGSAHGNTYDLGKGPNTYCSRCHSPENWDPESRPGPPPTCITCKFPTDEEVRITPFMDFVEEEDWAGINCHNCHIMEGDESTGQLAWLNTRTGEQEPVNTPNELCNKCHVDSGVSWTGGAGTTHHIELGGTAHINWAGMLDDVRRPEYCTDCHDPHTQEPMGCADCHPGVLSSDEHIKGNNAMHTNVDCMACHDASGAEVGPHPDEEMGGVWTTILNSVGRAGPTSEAITSHSVQWQVSCDRCHYAENAFELIELTADGEIPSDEPAGGPPGGGGG